MQVNTKVKVNFTLSEVFVACAVLFQRTGGETAPRGISDIVCNGRVLTTSLQQQQLVVSGTLSTMPAVPPGVETQGSRLAPGGAAVLVDTIFDFRASEHSALC